MSEPRYVYDDGCCPHGRLHVCPPQRAGRAVQDDGRKHYHRDGPWDTQEACWEIHMDPADERKGRGWSDPAQPIRQHGHTARCLDPAKAEADCDRDDLQRLLNAGGRAVQDAIRLLRHLAFADEGVAAEANATADALEDSDGRAVQDDGLDVENDELLRRLDGWTEDENPGPLIRWAAAHLRGELRAASPHEPAAHHPFGGYPPFDHPCKECGAPIESPQHVWRAAPPLHDPTGDES